MISALTRGPCFAEGGGAWWGLLGMRLFLPLPQNNNSVPRYGGRQRLGCLENEPLPFIGRGCFFAQDIDCLLERKDFLPLIAQTTD